MNSNRSLQGLEPLAAVAKEVEYGDPAGRMFFEAARDGLSPAAHRERSMRYALSLAHHVLNTQDPSDLEIEEALLVVDEALRL